MKLNRIPRRRQNRRGSAMVEFALMASLFLTMLGGTMDFSRVYYVSMQLNDAAMAGVQYAMLNNYNFPCAVRANCESAYSNIESKATEAQPHLTGMTAAASLLCYPADSAGVEGSAVDCGTAAGSDRQYLQMQTGSTYTLFTNYFNLPTSINLKGTAVVRLK